MLRAHPTLRYVLKRAAWYALTFFVALAINFFLPRLGDANPIDTIMAKTSSGLDSETAKQREEAYLKEFGLVEVDDRGAVLRDATGKPLKTSLPGQFARYLVMSMKGDLGTSILQHPRRVSDIIKTVLS
jgi:peptide/nickel transport system permease protein